MKNKKTPKELRKKYLKEFLEEMCKNDSLSKAYKDCTFTEEHKEKIQQIIEYSCDEILDNISRTFGKKVKKKKPKINLMEYLHVQMAYQPPSNEIHVKMGSIFKGYAAGLLDALGEEVGHYYYNAVHKRMGFLKSLLPRNPIISEYIGRLCAFHICKEYFPEKLKERKSITEAYLKAFKRDIHDKHYHGYKEALKDSEQFEELIKKSTINKNKLCFFLKNMPPKNKTFKKFFGLTLDEKLKKMEQRGRTKKYMVEARIETKGANDPEGATIYKYMIKPKYGDVISSVKPGKLLKFEVKAKSKEHAITIIENLVSDIRIYNPVAHELEIEAIKISFFKSLWKKFKKILKI